MDRRRQLLIAIGAAPLAASFAAVAQQSARLRRIGVISAAALSEGPTFGTFKQRLRELGYIEGKTVTIDYVSAEGKYERLSAIAADLVRRNVDVILTVGGTPAALAAKNATRSVPIVFTGVADPVGQGIVTNLARPGGNVTGLSLQHPQTAAKTLELLKEVVPSATRIALLSNPTNDSHPLVLQEMQAAARQLRIEASIVHVRSGEELENTIGEVKRLGAQGIAVLADSMLSRYSAKLASLAVVHRLPAIGGNYQFSERGGLLSYGANRPAHFRRAAELVDKILRGTKPADLPIEQPTKFDLIVNLKTANALGITMPQTVLVWADKVIQ